MSISVLSSGFSNITEKRREKRYVQHRRCLTVTIDGSTMPVIIRNISTWGGSCIGLMGARVGARFILTFEGSGSVIGRVQWVQDDVCGMRFLTPIGADKVFYNQRSQAERARRVSVARPATVVADGVPRRAIIRNVSENGMMLETFCQLRAGQSIDIMAGEFCSSGTVRWSSGKQAGVVLAAPLRLDIFERQSTSVSADVNRARPDGLHSASSDGGVHA